MKVQRQTPCYQMILIGNYTKVVILNTLISHFNIEGGFRSQVELQLRVEPYGACSFTKYYSDIM